MANTAEHKAAEQSLSDYIGYDLPLPHIAQKCLEWRLEEREDAKESLYQKLLDGLYLNNHSSFEAALKEALEGFNITEKDKP